MSFREIEFKYRANDIALSEFKKFCDSKAPKTYTEASGYDHFYTKKGEEGAFCRYRKGADIHQLTFKRKTVDSNNYVRTEHNIDLALKVSRDQIEALLLEFGYSYNTSIFKSCFIYKYDWYTAVFYTCYDEEMTELGRFMELEMSEDTEWQAGEAERELAVLEKLCKPLGILPQARVRRSLFELFRKEEK